jgi:hypothetical protein
MCTYMLGAKLAALLHTYYTTTVPVLMPFKTYRAVAYILHTLHRYSPDTVLEYTYLE